MSFIVCYVVHFADHLSPDSYPAHRIDVSAKRFIPCVWCHYCDVFPYGNVISPKIYKSLVMDIMDGERFIVNFVRKRSTVSCDLVINIL